MVPPPLPTVEGLVLFGSLGAGLLTVAILEKFGVSINEPMVKLVLIVLSVVGLGAFMFFHPFFISVLSGF